MKMRSLVAAAILLSAPRLCSAGKVKVWHHCAAVHYEKAQLKGAVVSNEGTLRLSRAVKTLVELDARHVWDVVESPQGDLFIATGDDGKLFKLSPEGRLSIAYTSPDSQILCLALSPDGSIYAGTGPGGTIVRVDPRGAAQVVCKTSESYVWSLAVDSRGETIFAGTGPKGRIYRVNRQGQATLFYATKQDHVLSLALSPRDTLFAGTDKNGLVYRFDDKGQGFVLFHAPQAEVRKLYWTEEGLYAGTSSPRRTSALGSSASPERGSHSDPVATLVSVRKSSTKTAVEGSKPVSSGAKDMEEKGSPASRIPAPSAGENSVYRIAPDGAQRELFREKALVLSLLPRNGRVLVGTGMEGQLFEVDEATKERSEVARLDHGQIQAMYRRRDGSMVIGTGDPGKLYVLQEPFVVRGTNVSEVLDAKGIGKWGALTWKADTPSGSRVSVAVRTGNLPEPDETWSDWSAEQTDPEQAVVTSPRAQYLQYRVTLTTENPAITPALHNLSIRYQTANQAPEVSAIDVPDFDAVNLENPKKAKIKWTATDANEDDLLFTVFVRKEGWKNWVLLEENYDTKDLEWDTTTTPSGIYRVKIVASDRKDNPPDEALTGVRISGSFIVTHAAPAVTMKVGGMEGDRAVIEASAIDPWVRLTSASFAVNGKKWVTVFPTDGLFDSKKEAFRFRTEALKPGSYVVVLRVRDAAGNTGTADTVFTVRGEDK